MSLLAFSLESVGRVPLITKVLSAVALRKKLLGLFRPDGRFFETFLIVLYSLDDQTNLLLPKRCSDHTINRSQLFHAGVCQVVQVEKNLRQIRRGHFPNPMNP